MTVPEVNEQMEQVRMLCDGWKKTTTTVRREPLSPWLRYVPGRREQAFSSSVSETFTISLFPQRVSHI